MKTFTVRELQFSSFQFVRRERGFVKFFYSLCSDSCSFELDYLNGINDVNVAPL